MKKKGSFNINKIGSLILIVVIVFVLIILANAFVPEAQSAGITLNKSGQTEMGRLFTPSGYAYVIIMSAFVLIIILGLFKIIKRK